MPTCACLEHLNLMLRSRSSGTSTVSSLAGHCLDPTSAWCPYCQKVWLWLESKQIPYRVRKVTMFCYGEKEQWYKQLVPSGMLPAVEINGEMVTESDEILYALEERFGALQDKPMDDPAVIPLRRLERLLFRAWCQWICYPTRSQDQDRYNQDQVHPLSVL